MNCLTIMATVKTDGVEHKCKLSFAKKKENVMQRTYQRLDTKEYFFGRIELAKALGCTPANVTNVQKGRAKFVIKGIEIEEIPFAIFPDEQWKKINDNYKISSLGRVVRCYKNKMDKLIFPNTIKNGYQQVQICVNGKRKGYFVHRLVAEAFIPNPKNKPFINHKNKATNDNRVENLEWCNAGENNRHARYYYLPLLEIKNIATTCLERGSGYDWVKALEKIEQICTKETNGYI